MRRSDQRLQVIESGLSPRELVLLHLEEGHRFGSVVEHAAHLAANPPALTFCEQIDRSISASREWESGAARIQAVREAQREALFLAFLVNHANASLAESVRGDATAALLLHSAVENFALREELGLEPGAFDFERLEALANDLLARVAACLDAADIVAHTYFDGRDILYPDLRRQYESHLEFAQHIVAGAATLWGDQWTVRSELEADADRRLLGRRRAQSWVDLAKIQTFDAMDERRNAERLLRQIVVAPS